jgi:chromosome segregation ATPase
MKDALDHMRAVCESQTTSLAQSNAKCDALSQELTSLEAELTEKTAALTDANRELDDARQGLAEAVSMIGSLQDEVRLSHEENALLRARLEGEQSEVARQRAKFAELSAHFDRKCDEVVALSISLDASRSQLTQDRLNSSYRSQEDRVVVASPSADRGLKSVANLERALGEKDAELEVCRARLEALRRRVANSSGSWAPTDVLSIEACAAVELSCEHEGLVESVATHELAAKIAQAKVDLLEGRVLSLHRELSEKRARSECSEDGETQCELITVDDDLRTLVARLEVQLAEALQTVKVTEAKYSNSDTVIDGLTIEVETLRGSCSQKDGFIASLQANLDSLATEAEDSAVALREARAECHSMSKLLAAQANEAEAAVLEFADTKAELESALEACQSEIRTLKLHHSRDKEAWMEQLSELQLTANARVADAVAEAEKYRGQADRYRLDYEADSDRISRLKSEVSGPGSISGLSWRH